MKLNSGKSEFFSAGMALSEIDIIQQETGFKVGSLPVRYFKVSLTSKKLSCKDCEPLLKKMREKIAGWFSKLLSFPGRLQLVQAVLCSMNGYWCHHFMLPKSVLKSIDSLSSSFMWSGTEGKLE